MAMGDPGAPPPQAPATFEKVDKTFIYLLHSPPFPIGLLPNGKRHMT